MNSPSKTFSPAKFKATVVKKVGKNEEIIYEEEKDMGMSEGPDEISIGNEFGIPGVFGQYSTMKTFIGIKARVNLNDEESLRKATEYWGLHIADNIQNLQNKILVLMGRKPHWESGEPKEEEPAKKKRKPKKG